MVLYIYVCIYVDIIYLFQILADIKSLLDQTTAANEAKFEAIATAEEAKMRESNLQVIFLTI